LAVSLKTESGIEQRVHPAMVPINAAIADVDGVTNCVAVDGEFIGDVMLIGLGAGAGPTATSVMSDIVDIARGVVYPPFVHPTGDLIPYERAKMRAHEGRYYLRLAVHDRPGAFAAIAQRMAEQNISLESVVQRRLQSVTDEDSHSSVTVPPMPVIMVTHETNESAIRRALEAIEIDGHVVGQAQMIRIENL
jgi:homoserine dehydrogenase